MEQSVVGKENFSSPADLEERKCLEEKLYWTRLELQRTIALSADADETICKLSSAARRAMQERDELRNQGKILLAELQARRNAHVMLAGRALSKSASIHGHSHALQPGRPKPFAGMLLQGRDAEAGCSYRFAAAAPSGFGGHRNTAAAAAACSASSVNPAAVLSSNEFACSSQEDPFDPDMFLVDPSESPQDFAPNTSNSDLGDDKRCITDEQMNVQPKGKSSQTV